MMLDNYKHARPHTRDISHTRLGNRCLLNVSLPSHRQQGPGQCLLVHPTLDCCPSMVPLGSFSASCQTDDMYRNIWQLPREEWGRWMLTAMQTCKTVRVRLRLQVLQLQECERSCMLMILFAMRNYSRRHALLEQHSLKLVGFVSLGWNFAFQCSTF